MNLTTINRTNKNAFHDRGFKGKGITIAVLGTGCNINDARIKRVAGFDQPDATGHESMVISLLLDYLPEATILSYNIFQNDPVTAITNALVDIVARSRKCGRYLVNMSLGTGYDADQHSLIRQLVAANVPVFAAAGNDGTESIGLYPSHYPEVICVSALNNDASRASFSTFHNEVDFAEVGTGVLVSVNGRSAVYNGTSVACPIVAAKAALMLCEQPMLTEPQLFARMKKCAVDLGYTGFDPYMGWGHINAVPAGVAATTPTASVRRQTVRYGDSGPEVTRLKNYLVRLGYLKASTHDKFRSDTRAAVKKFQKEHGLKADGVVGPATWPKLEQAIDALNSTKRLIPQCIAWTRTKIGDVYGWGAQGEILTEMKDPEAWLRKIETSTTNANRAIALFRQRKSEGRNPIAAFDCGGLFVRWLLDNGIIKSDMSSRGLFAACKEIKERAALQPGDFVFRHNGVKIYHIGMCTAPGKVIESMGRDVGVVERDIDASGPKYWNRYGRFEPLQK